MYLKAILKMNEKLNSKLGLPRVTIRDQIIPQPKSSKWLKKVSSMSSNRLPMNYYGALKTSLKICAKGQNRRSTVIHYWSKYEQKIKINK